MAVLVSIVIVTFNRAASLRDGLHSLAKLTFPEDCPVEILIVDNGSTDKTREVVSQYQRSYIKSNKVTISYCFEAQPGIPYARNRGIKESLGQWLVFFDDDQLADPDMLQELLDTSEKSGALCVGGSIHLLLPDKVDRPIPSFCRKLLGEHLGEGEFTSYSRNILPSTGNILIHNSLFKRYGSFNVEFLGGGEDSEFLLRLKHAGVKMVFSPQAIVSHVISKNRLTDAYLNRVAKRNGVALARCHHQLNGVLMHLCQTTLRFLNVVIQIVPHLLLVELTKDVTKTLELKCRLSKHMGYLFYTRQQFLSKKHEFQELFHRHSE